MTEEEIRAIVREEVEKAMQELAARIPEVVKHHQRRHG